MLGGTIGYVVAVAFVGFSGWIAWKHPREFNC